MSFVNKTTALARVVLPRCSRCLYSSESGSAAKGGGGSEASTPAAPAPAAPTPVTPAAPTPVTPAPAAVKPPATPASQPFDNTKYNSDMYYAHNEMSFYDIENEMEVNRVGQPSSLKTN